MAKIISPFVGSAKGKLGGAVYYGRQGGTFARQRVATVANPRSNSQMVTRVVLSTVAKAYSLFQPICDHSFEGKTGKAANYSRFAALNAFKLRETGVADTDAPFNGKGSGAALSRSWQVSEGSVRVPHYDVVNIDEDDTYACAMVLRFPINTEVTYAAICEKLGLPQGAQITLLSIDCPYGSAEIEDFAYPRIILNPSDGDMSSTFIATNAINKPNEKNTFANRLYVKVVNDTDEGYTKVYIGVVSGLGMEFQYIAPVFSYNDGSGWKYSTSEFNGAASPGDGMTMADAIASYATNGESSFYLNAGR